MNFSFTEDQNLLRDSVGRWLADKYDFATRRKILNAGGYSSQTWSEFAEMGWLALPFSEDLGGLAGSGVEAAIVMEAFGRNLVLEPWLWTVVIGGRLLTDGAHSERRASWIAGIIAGNLHLALATIERSGPHHLEHVETRAVREGESYRITGRKPMTPNGTIADFLVVSARTAGGTQDRQGVSLFLVPKDAPGVSIRYYRSHDGQSVADVTFQGARVAPENILGELGDGIPLLETAFDYGAAAVCAEAVGSAGYLIETTSAYLKTREQYGKPLAEFQVLQHRLADMYVANELSRSIAYFAALSLDAPPAERMRAVSAAKVQIARSSRFVGQQAVQLHGGMGMSEELDVAHHFKRLTIIGRQFGDEGYHLRRFAALPESFE